MTDTLAAALAAFQADLPRIEKGNTAEIRSEKGNYSYRYADLAEISPVVLPLLGRHGLAWSTRPTLTEDGRFVLRYALTHTSGEATGGDYPLPEPRSSPTVLGSAITYARRYTLCAVTGVAPGGDDDDAAEAQRRHPAVEARPVSEDDERRALRAAIAELARQQGRDVEWVPDDFAARTQGTDIRAGSVAELKAYLRWLEQQPDVWQSTQPSENGYDDDATSEQLPLPEDERAVNKKQLTKLGAYFTEHGITDRTQRLRIISAVLGRPVGSSKDLTLSQASTLIDALTKIAAEHGEHTADSLELLVTEAEQAAPGQQTASDERPAPAEPGVGR